MENYEERYGDVVPYKPYLQDGKTHLVTERDVTTSYWQAFYGAYADRFPDRNFTYVREEPVVVEEVETTEEEVVAVDEIIVEEIPATETKPACCKKYKKNVAAIAIGFVASVLAIALGVISYFKLFAPYTTFFADYGTDGVYNSVNGVINGSVTGMLAHGFVACFIVAGILTFVSFIVGIAALASKKKVAGVGALAIIAFVVALGAAAITFFADKIATDTASIINFINPLKAEGVQFGLYIGAALLLIEAICGFCSYKKIK